MDGTADSAFFLTRRTVSAVLRLSGELDIAAVDPLAEAVERLIDDGCASVEIDLSQVTFMDAAGLGGLVRAQARLRENGAALCVSNLCEQPRWLLRISGMESAFDIGDHQARPTLRGIVWT